MKSEVFSLAGVSDAAWAQAEEFLERLRHFRHARILPLASFERAGLELRLSGPAPEHVSLRTWLEREIRLPFLECGRVLGELAEALSAAHAAGFEHGALDDTRVLWSDVHVLVEGFGRTRLRALLAGATLATAFAADVRAFGSIGYQIVTGATYHDGAPAPNALREHVPPGLAALILRCLDKDPARRPSAADLARFTAGLVTPPTNWRAPMLVRQAAYLLATEAPPFNRAAERLARARELDRWCPGATALSVQLAVERSLLGMETAVTSLDESEPCLEAELAHASALRQLLATAGPSIDAAKRSTTLAAQDPEVWRTLSRLHLRRAEPSAAVQAALRAVELAPFSALAQHTLAECLLANEELSAALNACEQALALGAHWPTLLLRAAIRDRAGQTEAARLDRARAAAARPTLQSRAPA